MRKNGSVKNHLMFLSTIHLLMFAWVAGGCATSPKSDVPRETSLPATIEEIKVSSGEKGTAVVEIINSKPSPYTTFKLIDPPRVVLDIRGVPGNSLQKSQPVNNGIVNEILCDEGKSQSMTTRLVVGLERPVDYRVEQKDRVLVLTLEPGQASGTDAQAVTSLSAKPDKNQGETKADVKTGEPRIFFRPQALSLNQVLGVDFTMLGHGKSRLIVTMDKQAKHHLERTGAKGLLLTLEESTIPPLLLRRLDASHFEGAVDRVKGTFSPAEKQVSLAINLREMVPFHMDQTNGAITIDFGRTEVKPPEKTILPLIVSESLQNKPLKPTPLVQESSVRRPLSIPGLANNVKYTGASMTMDFVNADVTNILRLIGEVSNLNIIWGPEVKGKVSMRLKNVPWDQALDLILANNNLAKRREGNVIWVTTRAQLNQIEEEERRKQEDFEKRKREQAEKEEELRKREPIETRYITINYVDVENIKSIIEKTVKSPTGKITVDKASKTIIMTDGVSKIEEAKEVAKRLDKPTKQVMIEARIVEADTNFARELGINWQGQILKRNDTGVPFTTNADITNAAGYPPGGKLYQPSFSNNVPISSPTLGLVLTTLSGSGLTASFLDAQLALSETKGRSKILSSPKIVTRDTVKATIQQGTKLVLPSGTDSNGNKTFQLVDASLKLEVTPKITPNDKVIMEVSVNDDFPDFARTPPGSDNVPIAIKNATTTMMVGSGDTVIIGGIFKDNSSVQETGQPWLKEIPVLGWFFKSRNWSTDRTELLIFLTPTVLPSS